MDWTALATDATGWTLSVVLATLVARSLIRGDLVVGREYERLAKQLDDTAARAEALAVEQRQEAAAERARLLDQIAALQQRVEGEP